MADLTNKGTAPGAAEDTKANEAAKKAPTAPSASAKEASHKKASAEASKKPAEGPLSNEDLDAASGGKIKDKGRLKPFLS